MCDDTVITLSKRNVSNYFSDENKYNGNTEKMKEFISKIENSFRDPSISRKLDYALRMWASAEVGEDAGFAAEFVISLL